MKNILILILISFSLTLDSIEVGNNPYLRFGSQKVDTTNITLDFNKGKGIDLNFIKVDPKKGRISESFIGEPGINKIKLNSKNYIPEEVSSNDIAILETSKGTIKIKFFDDIAPNHVMNFKKLCNSGFYDKTSFHRVVKDFMIQGGDILSRDSNRENDGTGSPGWTVKSEFSSLKHKRGIVSMARSNDPNSAGSQFFICVQDAPWLDGQYTVFGEVVEGLDIVDRISKSVTDRDFMLKSMISKIPDGEDFDNWIEVIDPVTRKKIYSKIPMGETKSSYMDNVRKSLRSNNPYRRIEIVEARVYDNE